MASLTTPVATGRRVFAEFSGKNVSFMAAGIAYNAFVSLAPLLILVLLVASNVEGLEARLRGAAEESLLAPIADVVVGIFAAESAATGVRRRPGRCRLAVRRPGAVPPLGHAARARRGTGGRLLPDVLPLPGRGPGVAGPPPRGGVRGARLGGAPVRVPGVPGVHGRGAASVFGGVLVVVTWPYFSGLVLLLGAVPNAVVGDRSTGEPGGVGRGAVGPKPDAKAERSLDRAAADRASASALQRRGRSDRPEDPRR